MARSSPHVGTAGARGVSLQKVTSNRSVRKAGSNLELMRVDVAGQLVDVLPEALMPDNPDVREFPYGCVVLPVTDREGHAVVVVNQPGVAGRQDVLIIEQANQLAVQSRATEHYVDRRPGHDNRERLRVVMEPLKGDAGDCPASVAVLRFATGLGPGQRLDAPTRRRLAGIRYSIRPGDAAGWFEHGDDAFPEPAFRHGHPDIATRNQGDLGIRGPSRPAMGLRAPVDPALFAPHRLQPLDPARHTLLITEKGGQQRKCRISREGMRAISDYLREERGGDAEHHPDAAALFLPAATVVNSRGRLSPTLINRIWNEVCLFARVKHRTPHSARHAMGVHLVKKTGNPRTAQRQLGEPLHHHAVYAVHRGGDAGRAG
jgi:integrase-like protein